MKNEIKHENALRYMLGGRAYVNISNEISQQQRRFFILAVNEQGKTPKEVKVFVLDRYKVFIDPIGDKRKFLGNIREDRFTPDSSLKINSPKIYEYATNFNFIWKNLHNRELPTIYHILHLGNCSVCGRPLVDAPSLEIGIGPICLKRIQSFQNADQNEG